MWESIKCFFIEFNKWAWFALLFAFFDLVDIYGFIKPLLPEEWKDITLLNGWGFIICIIVILGASFMAFHNLRMKRMAEFLEYAPDFRRYKTFRIFSDLYKEGEFLKDASTSRRQEWDESVLVEMQKYCNSSFRINYLIDTRRRHDQDHVSPLEDEQYDKAVSRIKDYLDNMFEHYTK